MASSTYKTSDQKAIKPDIKWSKLIKKAKSIRLTTEKQEHSKFKIFACLNMAALGASFSSTMTCQTKMFPVKGRDSFNQIQG